MSASDVLSKLNAYVPVRAVVIRALSSVNYFRPFICATNNVKRRMLFTVFTVTLHVHSRGLSPCTFDCKF